MPPSGLSLFASSAEKAIWFNTHLVAFSALGVYAETLRLVLGFFFPLEIFFIRNVVSCV